MNLYLKEVEVSDKDEDRIKISRSNLKAVVACMKYLATKFGWSVITRNIDDPKDTGHNLLNIYTYTTSLKLENVKKQSYQYWGPNNGNDFPDVQQFHILILLQLLLTIHYSFCGFVLRWLQKWFYYRSKILSGLEPMDIKSIMDWWCCGWSWIKSIQPPRLEFQI